MIGSDHVSGAAAAASTAAGSIAAGAADAASLLPLSQLLEQTLAANPSIIRSAECALQTKAAAEDFAKELLLLLVNEQTSLPVKHAGAIYFKNYVKRKWDTDAQHGGLSETNRVLIKQHLLSLLLSSSTVKAVQLQLAEALARIAETDLPRDWPLLLPELAQNHLLPALQQLQQSMVGTHTGQLQQLAAALEILHTVLKKYRSASRCDDVLLELQQVLPAVQQPLHQVFTLALKLLQANIQAAAGVAVTNSSGISNCSSPGSAGLIGMQQPVLHAKELLEVLLLCCKVFFSLNAVDLPEFFEDHMLDFIGGFIQILKLNLSDQQLGSAAQPDDAQPGVLEKLQTQVFFNLKLYADKYQEEFQPYVMACTHAVWNSMERIDVRQKFDFAASAGMDYLSSAASTAWQQPSAADAAVAIDGFPCGDPFSDVQLLRDICDKIIVPNIQLRDCDIEQLEETPLDYARADLENTTHQTRRASALHLIKSLRRLHQEATTSILLLVVQRSLTQQQLHETSNDNSTSSGFYFSSAALRGGAMPCPSTSSTTTASTTTATTVPSTSSGSGGNFGGLSSSSSDIARAEGKAAGESLFLEERVVDASTCVVMAVSVCSSTRTRGVQSVDNTHVDIQQFFVNLLLPRLQSLDIDGKPILCMAAIKVVAAFRSLFDNQLLHAVLPLLVEHLGSRRIVIHTYAAYAIEKLLTARLNGQPRFDRAAIAPILKQAIQELLKLLESGTNARGSSSSSAGENEYVMKSLLRVFAFLKEEAAAEMLPALDAVLRAMKKIASNPSNPAFSHYLFECLATLVKLSSNKNSSVLLNSRPAVEQQVVPVLSVLVQQTVHDFVPYCFQILGLLLETAEEKNAGASQLYIELYQHLLEPSLWAASQANVPALIRLIACYCHRHALFAQLIQANMQKLLERFQYCLYHKKLMTSAFELLNVLLKLLPFSFYREYFPMLLTVLLRRAHELNKRKAICREVAQSLMLFQCKCEDSSTLMTTLEGIQTGLAQQVLSFIVLPAAIEASSFSSSTQTKKVLILGLARLSTCAAVANNRVLLGSTLEALATLISKRDEEERNVQRTQASVKDAAVDDDELLQDMGPLDAVTAAEFDVCYSRLAAADIHPLRDYVEDVTDLKSSVQCCLSPLKARIEELAMGGAHVRPLLAVLTL